MTTYRTLARLIALCLLLLAASVAAQEVLTNDSVIAMKKAGLSDAVILAKIRSSQSKFDVSTQSLVSLKQAGLSDQVIEAMVGHTGPGGTTLTAPAGAAARPPGGGLPQGRDSVYHYRGDQYIELAAAEGGSVGYLLGIAEKVSERPPGQTPMPS